MKPLRRRIAALLGQLGLPALAAAFPPGAPMSDFGPSQISLAAFFDHSGQDVFADAYPSVMNTTGLSIDYGPWPFVQAGLFAGAAEFDVGLPASRLKDTAAFAYNTDYSLSGGASLKLATPRFASGTTRAVGFGSLAYFGSEDGAGNSKRGLICNAGATVQWMALSGRLNLVLGGEFYTLVGEQEDARGRTGSRFANSQPAGIVDLGRGIVGVEWYFRGPNHPFISLAFRPTGSLGWDDNLGLRGGSISISLGAMTTLGRRSPEAVDEDPGILDGP